MKNYKKTQQSRTNFRSNKGSQIVSMSTSNYVQPDTTRGIVRPGSDPYILNGANNSFFLFLEQLYNTSPTNTAVINKYVKYIYGEGLYLNGMPVKNLFKPRDVKKFILDYVKCAQATGQVVYNKGRKVYSIEYTPVECIGIKNDGYTNDPTTYVFCRDWSERGIYPILEIKSFDSRETFIEDNTDKTEDSGTRQLYLRSNSKQRYYSLPTYFSGIEAILAEAEFQRYKHNHIKNGLSATAIVNVVRGILDGLEQQYDFVKEFRENYTGANNAANFILSINDNPETKTTIEALPDSNTLDKYKFLEDSSEKMILRSHAVTNSILFDVEKATGFSSNSQEMAMALKMIYRDTINPYREDIIDALLPVFEINFPGCTLEFKDFEDFTGTKEVESPVEESTDTEVTMAKSKKKGKTRPKPPFHDNCKCVVVGGKIDNADCCDYCQDIIDDFNY